MKQAFSSVSAVSITQSIGSTFCEASMRCISHAGLHLANEMVVKGMYVDPLVRL